MNNGSKYHGEIKVHVGPNEARINIFADTLAELFSDLGTVHAQLGMADPVTNPAKREIVNAERKAATLAQPLINQHLVRPEAGQQAAVQHDIPNCVHCGTWESMEIIEFKSKKDGSMKRAWKCQACEQWHFPNGKKS